MLPRAKLSINQPRRFTGTPKEPNASRIRLATACSLLLPRLSRRLPKLDDQIVLQRGMDGRLCVAAGEPLADTFGFPLRLHMTTKLDITTRNDHGIEMTNIYPSGFW